MSAVPPRLPGKSTLAPRFSSSLTISSWPLVAAAPRRPKAALASLGRVVDLDGQQGERALPGLGSVRWGGRRGSGRLLRRCVLPKELRGGRVALALGVPQGGAAIGVEQLGVGLGSQQGLHARLVP
eukprot:scaffold4323_cov57-Phaeocystis_antarctica.AAC.3